jgi:hypothetical protein
MATQSELEQNYGDPQTSSTIYISVVGVLIFVLTLIYLETLYYSTEEKERVEKLVDAPYRPLEEVREDQRALLNGYNYEHLYNDYQGRVTVPIEDAAAMLLEEWPNPATGYTPSTTGDAANDTTGEAEGTQSPQ